MEPPSANPYDQIDGAPAAGSPYARRPSSASSAPINAAYHQEDYQRTHQDATNASFPERRYSSGAYVSHQPLYPGSASSNHTTPSASQAHSQSITEIQNANFGHGQDYRGGIEGSGDALEALKREEAGLSEGYPELGSFLRQVDLAALASGSGQGHGYAGYGVGNASVGAQAGGTIGNMGDAGGDGDVHSEFRCGYCKAGFSSPEDYALHVDPADGVCYLQKIPS